MKNAFLGLGLLLTALSASAQVVYVSNLGEPANGGDSTIGSSTLREGISFTTGASVTMLSGVTLSFGESVAGNPTGFTLGIYSDSSGAPGTSLETLSGSAAPTQGNFSYASAGSTPLGANTTYWLVASNSGTGTAHISTTTSTSDTSAFGWMIGDHLVDSTNSGASYFAGSSFPWQLSVSATAIPEPATYAAFAGVITLGLVVWRRRLRAS